MKRWVMLIIAYASLLILSSNQATAKDTWTRVQTRTSPWSATLASATFAESYAAIEQLRWVKENGHKSFVEYPLALAELDRLETATAPKSEP